MSFCKSADDTWNQLLVPTLLGAAGTGAASGYLSSRNNDPDETPSERRHRIIRSALLGAGVGGLAGAAVPTGLNMLNSRVEPQPKSFLGSTIGWMRENPGKTLAGAGGLALGGRALRGGIPKPLLSEINRALKVVAPDAAPHTANSLATMFRSSKGTVGLRDLLAQGLGRAPGISADQAAMQAAELLRRAGGSHAATTGAQQLLPNLRSTLGEGNMLERWLSRKMTPKIGPIPTALPKRWDRLAQHYSGLVQPNIEGSLSGRLAKSTLGQTALGVTGGGLLGSLAGNVVPGLGDNN